MKNFPTPEFNTGIGFHYYPDDRHTRVSDLDYWLPELKDLSASWLTLRASPQRAIPESFLRALLEANIEPIIYMPVRPIDAVDLRDLKTLYSSYARWGVHYVVLYDQPNVRGAWDDSLWGREGLVGRFLDVAVPPMQLAQSQGLVPVFPAMRQGGDYWDLSFLENALILLKQRGHSELLSSMAFAHYAFAANRPPEWGAGGASRWTSTRPYITPPGAEDQRGFRSFEWYAEVILAQLGEARPLLMLAGGASYTAPPDPSLPPLDDARHASCNIAIAEAMTTRTLPAYLLNVSYWLLAADHGPYAADAWYRPGDDPLPAVAQLLRTLNTESVEQLRAAESDATPRKAQSHKHIRHYVLISAAEGTGIEWYAAMDYARNVRATCGFSADEAKTADKVTIVGTEQKISPDIERALRAAGCEVHRVSGFDIRSRLAQLGHAGTRFATSNAEGKAE